MVDNQNELDNHIVGLDEALNGIPSQQQSNRSAQKCSQCGKRCRTADQLRSHILREHPITNDHPFIEKQGHITLSVKNSTDISTKSKTLSSIKPVKCTFERNVSVVLKRLPESVLKKYLNNSNRKLRSTGSRGNVTTKKSRRKINVGKDDANGVTDRKISTCSLAKVPSLNGKEKNSDNCTCDLNVGTPVVVLEPLTTENMVEEQPQCSVNQQETAGSQISDAGESQTL